MESFQRVFFFFLKLDLSPQAEGVLLLWHQWNPCCVLQHQSSQEWAVCRRCERRASSWNSSLFWWGQVLLIASGWVVILMLGPLHCGLSPRWLLHQVSLCCGLSCHQVPAGAGVFWGGAERNQACVRVAWTGQLLGNARQQQAVPAQVEPRH